MVRYLISLLILLMLVSLMSERAWPHESGRVHEVENQLAISDGANEDNHVHLNYMGAYEGSLYPLLDKGGDLGKSANRWDDIFLGKIDSLAITSEDNLKLAKSNSSTSWVINAGRTAFFDNWLLFKNSAEAGNYTFAISNNGAFRGKDGSAGAPTYTFDQASNYGMSYDGGANEGLVLSTEGFSRLRVEDTGQLSVVGTPNYETLVTDDDDVPNKKYVDDKVAAIIWGSHYQSVTSSGQSQTTSTTFQQKLRLTTTSLPAGEYIVHFSATVGNTNNDKEFGARFQINDTTTLGELDVKIKEGVTGNGPRLTFSGMRIVIISGVNNFDIDYRAGSNTATIEDATIVLWRAN